jgi:Flp pilus assembly pilin Flp
MDKLMTLLPPQLRELRLPGSTIARCRLGATAIEYALIGAMIALALVTALHSLRGSLIGLPMERIQAAIAAVL